MVKFAKYYITTSIVYSNAKPHIGFALELLQADVLARWHRSLGEKVFFLTGTDEHGTKIFRTAQEAGISAQEFVDKIAVSVKELIKLLKVSNDNFIRTTDRKIHWPGVEQIWKALVKSGDIYKKQYEGLYCVGCESFILPKDLVEGKCPIHLKAPEIIVEENYFFKLSKYSKQVQKLIESSKLVVEPDSRKNEILSFIREGLQDVSFSRQKNASPWGIPVPGDPDQTMYVWCDALINYLTGIGYPDKKFKIFWPADLHIIGKDIHRFHAAIWPAMLLSTGLPLPKKIFIHGFILAEGGVKMSKSLGNVVDPFEQIQKYGPELVRYFLLREIPTADDGEYSERVLIQRNNADLANELGNLVSRVISLIEKYTREVPSGTVDPEIKRLAEKTLRDVSKHIDTIELHHALESIWTFVREVNKYVQDNQPWELAKSNRKKLKDVLRTLAESLRFISAVLWPFLPETAEKIAQQIGLKKVPEIKNFKFGTGKFGAVKSAGILFPKIEPKPDTQRYEPFRKLELRVGKIISVEDLPNTDKLYKAKVGFGEKTLQSVIGLKKYYLKSDLQDKKAVFVANLEPAKVCGEFSEAMILAASDGKELEILEASKSAVGEQIILDGVEPKPIPKLSFKEFQKIVLVVGAGRKVRFSDKVLRTNKEEIKIKRIGEGAKVC